MSTEHDISELARLRGLAALDTLEEIMDDELAANRDRVRAAEALLDRGYGKAAQAIIQVPANRRQAALLASMSDEALVAVIEQKQLPRMGAPQAMITIGPTVPAASAHGPAADAYADATELDPLLL